MPAALNPVPTQARGVAIFLAIGTILLAGATVWQAIDTGLASRTKLSQNVCATPVEIVHKDHRWLVCAQSQAQSQSMDDAWARSEHALPNLCNPIIHPTDLHAGDRLVIESVGDEQQGAAHPDGREEHGRHDNHDMCIYVPGGMSGAWRLLLGLGLNLNQATVHDFALLPGIGEKTAQALVAFRDQHGAYQQIADLTAVRGVGPATVRRLQPFLRIEEEGR